jgi:hypothetical protein
MKTKHLITSIACGVLAMPSLVHAAAEGQQTFTGRVGFSRPQVAANVAGGPSGPQSTIKLANLAFSGSIQTQGEIDKTINVETGKTVNFTGALSRVTRVSNKSILEATLPTNVSTRGYSLRVVFFYNKAPVVQAVKKNATPYTVDSDVLGLDVSWPAALEGAFAGTASLTATSTASGTTTFLTSGRARGFNSILGNLNLNAGEAGAPAAIVFSGAGAFTETTKGFTGSANVAGDNYSPVPVF